MNQIVNALTQFVLLLLLFAAVILLSAGCSNANRDFEASATKNLYKNVTAGSDGRRP